MMNDIEWCINVLDKYSDINGIRNAVGKLRKVIATRKRCSFCGKWFIPKSRSDELLCGKCKIIPQEKRIRDCFQILFRKAYKTQHRRISYHNEEADYKEKHFNPWVKAAKEAMNEFKLNNDFDGFEKWVEDNKNSF